MFSASASHLRSVHRFHGCEPCCTSCFAKKEVHVVVGQNAHSQCNHCESLLNLLFSRKPLFSTQWSAHQLRGEFPGLPEWLPEPTGRCCRVGLPQFDVDGRMEWCSQFGSSHLPQSTCCASGCVHFGSLFKRFSMPRKGWNDVPVVREKTLEQVRNDAPTRMSRLHRWRCGGEEGFAVGFGQGPQTS